MTDPERGRRPCYRTGKKGGIPSERGKACRGKACKEVGEGPAWKGRGRFHPLLCPEKEESTGFSFCTSEVRPMLDWSAQAPDEGPNATIFGNLVPMGPLPPVIVSLFTCLPY